MNCKELARKSFPFISQPISLFILAVSAIPALAQQPETSSDGSTVVYSAAYFEQYQPFSAEDMLDRIPGINIARDVGNDNSNTSTSNDSSRRGLGLGGDQVLINGRRIAGKENEGSSQLSRIPANQVQRIEIIRGTSGDLEVRGGSQVINIVLLQSQSRSSIAFETSATYYHDGEVNPAGSLSLSGQNGNFDYLLSIESESDWVYRDSIEKSALADGTPNDTIFRTVNTDSQPFTLSTNLGYQIGDNDVVHFNAQYQDNDAPEYTDRAIINLLASPSETSIEQDDIDHSGDFWEVGGDYEHLFGNGSRWKTLFIVNQKEDDSLRERFELLEGTLNKDLFLSTFNRYQERIVRSSYTTGLTLTQDIELGLERAQTILDSSLRLGLLTSTDDASPEFGGLSPITNSNATVEEIRYEGFIVHNWQINDRMSLESTLVFEQSEISQSGDVSKKRDFDFVRPKLDYRFDITPSLQFRASVEKDIAQLSFNDFTANVSTFDDDQNTVEGNPSLRQEQSWRYDLNLEYRFNNDNGVINTNAYYHDLEDVIGRIDVTTPTSILSANGNIGDGERYGLKIDASLRLAAFDLPQVLVTSSVEVQASSVTDAFTGEDRRLLRQGRGNYVAGFRHDMTSRNISYGLQYDDNIDGGIYRYDIDKIDSFDRGPRVEFFLETRGWGGLTYRFEATDFHDPRRCRTRHRFNNGTIGTGTLSEIEKSCGEFGAEYALRIRGTF